MSQNFAPVAASRSLQYRLSILEKLKPDMWIGERISRNQAINLLTFSRILFKEFQPGWYINIQILYSDQGANRRPHAFHNARAAPIHSDPGAFITIVDSSEIVGKGFRGTN